MAATGSLVHQDIGSTINGTSFFTMGENILVGPAGYSPDQMETAWMNSPTHRANILNGAFNAGRCRHRVQRRRPHVGLRRLRRLVVRRTQVSCAAVRERMV